ncbi:MAG TPA: recombinase RecT [Candidatus Hydrogenedentes bacterium]|nr:recombinase RecT [Candidatus Hydrogenedentota bacterium]
MTPIAIRLRELLPRLRAIAQAGTPVEEIVENVIYVINRDGDLANCSVPSILEAVAEAVAMGLDPSGLSNEGTLIPRKTKGGGYRAVFVPDYRAILRIMLSNPRISHIEARTVRKGDQFELRFGDPEGRIVEHRPAIAAEPGEPIGAYAIAWFKDFDRPLVEWMTKAEIEANAERGGSFGNENSPWETDWGEMARKTVIKRLAKYLPHQFSRSGESAAADNPQAAAGSPTEAANHELGDLASQYLRSIETAAPDGIDGVIQAIREDDRLDHMEKTELFNLAVKRKRELARQRRETGGSNDKNDHGEG